jgi:hypothetical protein
MGRTRIAVLGAARLIAHCLGRNQMKFSAFAVRMLKCAVLLHVIGVVSAADFAVRTPGGQFAFAINGTNTATLTLVRGRTYTFDVSTSGFHPFRINSTGVSANGISSGTINFTVPMTAQNYTYDCTVHGASMQGTLVTVAPPAPAVPTFIGYSFRSNTIVLRSTPATNLFTFTPEYKTNLNHTNWLPLTIQSNRFVGSTNETFCGVPPATNVFIRMKVQ